MLKTKLLHFASHQVLLRKPEWYGIQGITNDWFNSYLKTRTLRCKCKLVTEGQEVYSEEYPVEYGAPQRSVLGPLLFLIFTNDLYEHLEKCGCILFADDTTMYMSHKNLTYINHCIEHDLNIVSDWFKANLLTLNPAQTVAMVFTHPKSIRKISNISLDNAKIPFIMETKFLGMWLDRDLSWNSHLMKLCAKLKCNLHLVGNQKNLLDPSTLKLIYLAQIQSHINYGLLL